VQFDDPVLFLKVSLPHAVHGPPLSPVLPGTHRHPVTTTPSTQASGSHEALPGAENVCSGHAWHADAPRTAENVFAGQYKHGATDDPPNRYLPAAQITHMLPETVDTKLSIKRICTACILVYYMSFIFLFRTSHFSKSAIRD
jgi:hypothetical protein